MTRLRRVGQAADWAISAVARALCFVAQTRLNGAHGSTSREVWAWPASTDLAGLTGMLVAPDQEGAAAVVARHESREGSA